jgi:two-component system sensor histidine kinase YesM
MKIEKKLLSHRGHTVLNQISSKLRRYSLRKRFFAIFLCLCIIPLLIASVIVFLSSYRSEANRYVSFAQQMMAQMGDNLYSRLLSMRADAIDLAYNLSVQEFVREYSAESTSAGRVPVTEEVARAVTGKFDSTSAGAGLLILSTYGSPCYFYNHQDRASLLFYEDAEAEVMRGIEESKSGFWHYATPMDYYLKDLNGKAYPAQSEEPVLYYGLKMKRLVGTEFVGYLIITFRRGLLTDLFSNLEKDRVSTVYLMDQEGNVIIHNGEQSSSKQRVIAEKILEHRGSGIQTITPENPYSGDYIIYLQMEEIGWYVVDAIDGATLSKIALASSFDIILLIVLVMLLVPFFFMILSKSLQNPLHRILSALGRVESGDFSVRIKDSGNDEFTQISHSIDSMTSALEQMVEQIRLNEQQQKEAEIELLQMQINPHFITNTLNTVAWMAKLQRQENISTILTSLSELLNQTLRSGRDFIPLSEELRYIRWYIEIQQYKGTVQYRLNINVDKELLDCQIPPFTLEALVENSVTHGIVANRGSLEITVKAMRTADTLECIVIDNGAGMDRDTLEKLGKPSGVSGRGLYRIHGIGVANVQKRLQIYFGEEYGITFDSVQGKFTMATVRMPVRKATTKEGRNQDVSCDDCR